MDLGLYVITASVPELGRDHVDIARAAVEGGADAVQMRVKRRPMGEALKMAIAINEVTSKAGIPLIINDHVGIAMASRAEGLHVGPDDIALTAARRMLGDSVIIGESTSKHDQAIKAEKLGADYVGVGPVFSSPTKPGKQELGVARITKVKAVVGIPVVAIGGINAGNVAECVEAGADSVAVISAVTMAEDMVKAVAELKEALMKARQSRKRKTGSRK
ncbi:MAG: thiamine phosphate synthase [Gaiellales bacterium]|nr:MAG: thiamine phosphate synthase [Gaiellales bacterium]